MFDSGELHSMSIPWRVRIYFFQNITLLLAPVKKMLKANQLVPSSKIKEKNIGESTAQSKFSGVIYTSMFSFFGKEFQYHASNERVFIKFPSFL